MRYFCDLGRTDQFAYLFQLYNSRPLSFAEFSGPDIMPLPLVRLVGQVKGLSSPRPTMTLPPRNGGMPSGNATPIRSSSAL